jgi:aminoglycoside phosphotransferase (APT) family kinase protein
MNSQALIGKGFMSEVYAWGEGRVLKLFYSWVPAFKAAREYKATRVVHAAGIPVPACHELIEIEGRQGIVFERIDGVTMMRYVRTKPWTMFQLTRQLAELHARIHRAECPIDLPSQREWIATRIEALDLGEAEKAAIHRNLAALPDGSAICHGDFHPENVLLTSRGPVIIDWDSATRGHPLGDLACTSRLFRNAGLPPGAPSFMHLLVKCSRRVLHRTYLKRYLQVHAGTREEIESWRKTIAAALGPWRIPDQIAGGAPYKPENTSEKCHKRS